MFNTPFFWWPIIFLAIFLVDRFFFNSKLFNYGKVNREQNTVLVAEKQEVQNPPKPKPPVFPFILGGIIIVILNTVLSYLFLLNLDSAGSWEGYTDLIKMLFAFPIMIGISIWIPMALYRHDIMPGSNTQNTIMFILALLAGVIPSFILLLFALL